MARTQGKILTRIWTDDDWCALTRTAQALYVQILSQPNLTIAGSIDLMPARWARLSRDGTEAAVLADLALLEAHRFVVVDDDELVVRSFTRNDLAVGAVNVNLVKGFWSAWLGIRSKALRKVIVDNLPDPIWARCPDNVPDQAKELRSEPQLELPLQPQSEPSVDLLTADCGLRSADCSHDDSQNHSDSAPIPTPGAVVAVDEQMVNRALLAYSRIVTDRTPGVLSYDAFAAGVRRDAITEGIPDDLRVLLIAGHDVDAAAAERAGRSEAAVDGPRNVPAAESTHPLLRPVPTFCGGCEDGWLFTDGNDVARCPKCNPNPIGAAS